MLAGEDKYNQRKKIIDAILLIQDKTKPWNLIRAVIVL